MEIKLEFKLHKPRYINIHARCDLTLCITSNMYNKPGYIAFNVYSMKLKSLISYNSLKSHIGTYCLFGNTVFSELIHTCSYLDRNLKFYVVLNSWQHWTSNNNWKFEFHHYCQTVSTESLVDVGLFCNESLSMLDFSPFITAQNTVTYVKLNLYLSDHKEAMDILVSVIKM
jgi:hypothetical protein